MDDDFGVFARLAELSGELSRFDNRAMRDLFTRRITNDDVRAGIVAGVQPQVVRLRDLEREVVVVRRGAADEYLVTIGRQVATHAGYACVPCGRSFGLFDWYLVRSFRCNEGR